MKAAQVSAAAAPLAPGTLVVLRYCPYGEPGRVLGASRGKVVVEWRDLGTTGKYAPGSLIVVPAPSGR